MRLPKIGELYNIRQLPTGGKTQDRYFELTKLQTFDLLTGYNIELRIRVIRRWEELETQALTLPAQTLEVSDNTPALLDMLYDICQIKEHNLRIALAQKVINLQNGDLQLMPTDDMQARTEHSEACRMIVLQAVDTYYQGYMRTFMNHKGLSVAAAILEMAYDYIRAHKIPLRGRYKRTTFYEDMAYAIKQHGIKYLPTTSRPLKDKLREYDAGASIAVLIRLKNAGNQNAKRL